MSNARNWYLYIMTAISLHGVAWTVIILLRILFLSEIMNVDALALQLSILIIGFPVYLGHWLWAQRLAKGNLEERVCIQRQLFLFSVLLGTFSPVINNVFQILNQSLFEKEKNAFVINIVPIVVLTTIFVYHYMVQKDAQSALEKEDSYLTLRQIFVLGFSFTGLGMLFYGSINILNFIIGEIKGDLGGPVFGNLGSEVIRLVLGTLLWGVFWSWSQRSYRQSPNELSATYRWGYLYLILIISTFSTITLIGAILDSLIGSMIGIDTPGGDSLVIPPLIMMGLLWFYHAYVLQKSDHTDEIGEKQKQIQWFYHYLVSLVGFVTFVVGITGLLHLFIRFFLLGYSGDALNDDIAMYTSMVLAGLPTWVIAWRTIGNRITRNEEEGERHSSIRKYYLYLIVLGSAITIIDGLIYILYQLILIILGTSGGSFLNETAVFVANILVAGVVLAYHWSILRVDGQLTTVKKIADLEVVRAAVLDTPEGMGVDVLEALKEGFPGMRLALINPFEESDQVEEHRKAIEDAEILILPTSLLKHKNHLQNQTVQAAFSSPGKKLLIPQYMEGFEWVGVRIYDSNGLSKRTAKTVKKILAGETQISEKPLGCLAIGGIILGIIIILSLLTSLVGLFLY